MQIATKTTISLIALTLSITTLCADWIYNGSDTITETGDGVVTPWKIYVASNGAGFLQLKQKANSASYGQIGKKADGTTSAIDLNATIRLATDSNVTYKINKMQEGFFKSKAIVSIVLPDAMTALPQTAFRECSTLTNVVIGKNISSIGYMAFYGARNISSELVFNAKEITLIAADAFYGCYNLPGIIFNGEITASDIPANAFRECRKLKILKLSGVMNPSGLNSFGDYCFMGTILKELWMPKYPTWGSRVWEARNGYGITAYNGVVYINRNNLKWSNAYKPWGELSDAVKAKWTRTDIRPLGLTTADPKNQWILSWPKGLLITVR